MTAILQRFVRGVLTVATASGVSVAWVEPGMSAQAPSATLPIVTSANTPFYPAGANLIGQYGVVHAKVATDGASVVDVTVFDGPGLLRQATVENLRTWRFRPSIPTEFFVEFEYTLTYAPPCSAEQNAVVVMNLPTKVHITKPRLYACITDTGSLKGEQTFSFPLNSPPLTYRVAARLASVPNAVRLALAHLCEGCGIAEPGARWNSTDVIVDASLPARRLVWAGNAGSRWFIRYEHGGRGLHEHIVVFEVTGSGVVWRGGGSGTAGSAPKEFSVCQEASTCEW